MVLTAPFIDGGARDEPSPFLPEVVLKNWGTAVWVPCNRDPTTTIKGGVEVQFVAVAGTNARTNEE